MSAADVALNVAGALLGAAAASLVGVWLWMRRCERMSERGFGE